MKPKKIDYGEFLESRKLCCRKCGELMEQKSLGGDIFSMFTVVYYCNNNKCEDFGYLTVAGIGKSK